MRITILTQWFDPEPVATPGLALPSWLAARGHEVAVIAGVPNYPGGTTYPDYSAWRRTSERRDGITVVRVPVYPSHDRSAARRAANYGSYAASVLARASSLVRNADVLYARTPPTTAIPALVARRRFKVPFVYHVVDLWPESATESGMLGHSRPAKAIGTLLGKLDASICASASSIAVCAPGYRRVLAERAVPDHKVELVYNWAEEAIFRPTPRDEALARAFGLDDCFIVMYAGNLGDLQGLEVAIDAARAVGHLPRFRLVVVGDGNAAHSLRAYAESTGATNVTFLGKQAFENMTKVSALAHVQLVSLRDLPLFTMTIPGKTQAALAAGQVVLMAVRGDAAELLDESSAGVTCDPGDSASMAAAFERLYRTPESELAAMGRRGRQYYEDRLSVAAAGARFESMMLRASGRAADR